MIHTMYSFETNKLAFTIQMRQKDVKYPQQRRYGYQIKGIFALKKD